MAIPLAFRLTIPGTGSTYAPGDLTDDIDPATNFYITSMRRRDHPYIVEAPEFEGASFDPITGAVTDAEMTVTMADVPETDPGTPGDDISEDFEADVDISEAIARGWSFTSAQGAGVGGGGDTTPTIGGLPSPHKGFFWNAILFGDVFGMPPDNDVHAEITFTGLVPQSTYRVEWSHFNISYGLNLSGQGGKAHVSVVTSGGVATFDEAGYPTYPVGHVLTANDYYTSAVYVSTGAGTTLTFGLTIGEVNGESQISAGLDYVKVVYVPGSGAATDRYLTMRLADATARQELLHRPAFVEISADDGASWPAPHFAGYVTGIELLDALTARITLGDTRRTERTFRAFRGIDPTAAGPFTHITPVLGGPVYGGLTGVLADFGLPLFKVTRVQPKVFGAPGYINLEFLSGPLPDDFNGHFPIGPENGLETVNSRAHEFFTRGTAPYPVIDVGGEKRTGQYPNLRAWLFDPATGDVTAFPAMIPLARFGIVGSPGSLFPRYDDVLIDVSTKHMTLQLDIGPPATLPAVNDRYLVLIAPTEISTNFPLYWAGHPVDFLTALHDLADIPYDSASATACRDSLGADLVVILAYRDPAMTMQAVCEEIGRFFRILIQTDGTASGQERIFRHYGARVDTAPASSIMDADLADADANPFSLTTDNIVNRIAASTLTLTPFAGAAREARPYSALVEHRPTFTLDYSTDGGVTHDADVYGARELTLNLPGQLMWYAAGPVPMNPDQYHKGQARDLFSRHGRGTPYYTVHTIGQPTSGTFAGALGDPQLVDVSHLPSALVGRTPPSQRGGARWMRLARIDTDDMANLSLRLYDESTGQPFGATVTLAVSDNADDPVHARDVEFSGTSTFAAANAHLEVEVAFGDAPPSDHGVRVTILDPEDLGDDPVTVVFGNLPPNVDVWFRARGFIDQGAPGDWSDWTNTGTTIPTPTGDISNLVVAVITTDGALLTWDNANSTGNVKIEARESGTTPYTFSRIIPATSTAYAISGLLPDTMYDVRVVLVDPFIPGPAGEFGTVLTDSFTTGDMTGAPTLGIPFDQHSFSGYDSSGNVHPGVFGLVCTPDPDTVDVVFDLAVESSVGSDIPTGWAMIATVPASAGIPYVWVELTAPNDGLRRYLRAHAEAPGYNDSPNTAQFRCDPWGISDPPQPFSVNPPLSRLPDMNIAGIADQEGIKWDDATQMFVPTSLGGAVAALDDLSDVTITSPAAGDMLVDASGGAYVNAPVSSVLGYHPLASFSDTGPLGGASAGDIAQFDGTDWQPVDPSTLGASRYIAAAEADQNADENDNFQTASLDTGGTRRSGAIAWSWVNQGDATATQQFNRLELKAPSSGSQNVRAIVQAVPSGTWKYRAHVAYINPASGSSSMAGFVLRDSGSGKLELHALGNSSGTYVWASKWNSPTSFNATRTTNTITVAQSLWPTILEIENDGTNYILRFGHDELNMIELTNFAKTNFLTSAADGIGLFAYNDCSQDTWLYCREFYRVA